MKEILSEGRYDKVTTDLSREVIQGVVQGKKRVATRFMLFTRTFVDLSVYIHYTDGRSWRYNNEPMVYGGVFLNPKAIRKHYKNKRIVLHVEVPLNTETRKEKMNLLIPELKNIIRHEIEHVSQTKFIEKERKNLFSNRSWPETLEYWEYLIEPYEVEAYIRGLYKKAKTLKQPLKVVLDDWWIYLESRHMHDDEIQSIKDAWIGYAKKHLPKTEFRKYGYSDDDQYEGEITENRVMGFKYKKPDVNCIIHLEAPDAGNIRFKLMDFLDRMDVNFNSVTGGGGQFNAYTLNLNLYDEKEAAVIVDDLRIKLMLDHVSVNSITYKIPGKEEPVFKAPEMPLIHTEDPHKEGIFIKAKDIKLPEIFKEGKEDYNWAKDIIKTVTKDTVKAVKKNDETTIIELIQGLFHNTRYRIEIVEDEYIEINDSNGGTYVDFSRDNFSIKRIEKKLKAAIEDDGELNDEEGVSVPFTNADIQKEYEDLYEILKPLFVLTKKKKKINENEEYFEESQEFCVGNRVVMSAEFKNRFGETHPSYGHILEFGDLIGTIKDIVEWRDSDGDSLPCVDIREYDNDEIDIEVEWGESGLSYTYDYTALLKRVNFSDFYNAEFFTESSRSEIPKYKKLKAGDAVIVNGIYTAAMIKKDFSNEIGKILLFDNSGYPLIVFNNWYQGHDGLYNEEIGDECFDKKCWYFTENFVGTIEKIPEINIEWNQIFESVLTEEDDKENHQDFNVGDTVLVNGTYGHSVKIFIDEIGVIIDFNLGHQPLVAFRKWNQGHNGERSKSKLRHLCEGNKCFYLNHNFHGKIEKIPEINIEWDQIFESVLTEGKKETLREKYKQVDDATFEQILDSDPSATKKYAEWMLKSVFERDYSPQETITAVQKFHKLNASINAHAIEVGTYQFGNKLGIQIPSKDVSLILSSPKDINSYAGPGILMAVLNVVEATKVKKEAKLKDAERIYEDDYFLVVQPKTRAASCKYGANTHWCVAGRDGDHFDDYSRGGTLYYILFKTKSALNPDARNLPVWKEKRLPRFEKIARYIHHGLEYGAEGEYYNVEDEQMENVDGIFNQFFGIKWDRDGIMIVPSGTKAFYDSWYQLTIAIDTHYAQNGMTKERSSDDDVGENDEPNDWDNDWERDDDPNEHN